MHLLWCAETNSAPIRLLEELGFDRIEASPEAFMYTKRMGEEEYKASFSPNPTMDKE